MAKLRPLRLKINREVPPDSKYRYFVIIDKKRRYVQIDVESLPKSLRAMPENDMIKTLSKTMMTKVKQPKFKRGADSRTSYGGPGPKPPKQPPNEPPPPPSPSNQKKPPKKEKKPNVDLLMKLAMLRKESDLKKNELADRELAETRAIEKKTAQDERLALVEYRRQDMELRKDAAALDDKLRADLATASNDRERQRLILDAEKQRAELDLRAKMAQDELALKTKMNNEEMRFRALEQANKLQIKDAELKAIEERKAAERESMAEFRAQERQRQAEFMAILQTLGKNVAEQERAKIEYQAPIFKAPTFEAPHYPAPKYEQVEYPAPRYGQVEYPAPRYGQVEYPAPQYQAPQFPAPQYQAPFIMGPPGNPPEGPANFGPGGGLGASIEKKKLKEEPELGPEKKIPEKVYKAEDVMNLPSETYINIKVEDIKKQKEKIEKEVAEKTAEEYKNMTNFQEIIEGSAPDEYYEELTKFINSFPAYSFALHQLGLDIESPTQNKIYTVDNIKNMIADLYVNQYDEEDPRTNLFDEIYDKASKVNGLSNIAKIVTEQIKEAAIKGAEKNVEDALISAESALKKMQSPESQLKDVAKKLEERKEEIFKPDVILSGLPKPPQTNPMAEESLSKLQAVPKYNPEEFETMKKISSIQKPTSSKIEPIKPSQNQPVEPPPPKFSHGYKSDIDTAIIEAESDKNAYVPVKNPGTTGVKKYHPIYDPEPDIVPKIESSAKSLADYISDMEIARAETQAAAANLMAASNLPLSEADRFKIRMDELDAKINRGGDDIEKLAAEYKKSEDAKKRELAMIKGKKITIKQAVDEMRELNDKADLLEAEIKMKSARRKNNMLELDLANNELQKSKKEMEDAAAAYLSQPDIQPSGVAPAQSQSPEDLVNDINRFLSSLENEKKASQEFASANPEISQVVEGAGSMDRTRRFGGSPLSDIQIDKMMTAIDASDDFVGAITSDEIEDVNPEIWHDNGKISMIVNTKTDEYFKKNDDPVGHWVGIVVDKTSINYFDPFGNKAPKAILKPLSKLVEKINPPTYLKLKESNVKWQDINSANCGWFAMLFIINMMNGAKFAEATGFKPANEKRDISGYGENAISALKKLVKEPRDFDGYL